MSEIRAKAWATRRQRYGPAGHRGSYSRCGLGAVARRALTLMVRLHYEGTLSEGQCCKALDIDRVSFRRLCDDLYPPVERALQL